MSEPAITCERCPHPRHLGECPVEVEKGPILSDCGCFYAGQTIPDVRTLRRQDAAQQREIANAVRNARPYHRRAGPGVPLEVYSSIGYTERDGDSLPWDEPAGGTTE